MDIVQLRGLYKEGDAVKAGQAARRFLAYTATPSTTTVILFSAGLVVPINPMTMKLFKITKYYYPINPFPIENRCCGVAVMGSTRVFDITMRVAEGTR